MADAPARKPAAKKKQAAIIAVLAVLIVGVAVYRSKHHAAAAPAGAAADPSVDPATGIPYAQENSAGIDPLTGVPYSQESGYGAGYGAGGFPYPVTGSAGQGSTTPAFTDNASWAQYAESYLAGLGGDPQTIGNALGKYITGQPVTAAQQGLIEQAIAFAGKPPVAGSGGFPPSIFLTRAPGSRQVAQHTVSASGNQDLQQIANSNGITEAVLNQANPALARKYAGTGHHLPRGTKVIIPAHTEST